MQPELAGHEYVLERQLKPEARKDVKQILNGLGIRPTAMIDLSDGLSSDLLHLCTASGVGCRIYEEKIPVDPTVYDLCTDFSLNTTTVALNGGEDYELLFTVPIAHHQDIQQNPNLTIIGHITEEKTGTYLVTRADEAVALKARGWNALLNKSGEEDA
jgi:thiamine-monophosphate kinase